jgi:hypothetical protein
LISSKELPQTNTSQVNDNGSQDEGIIIIKNDIPEAVNDEEDEDDSNGWTTIFDAIDQLDEEEYQDKCHFIDTAVNESLINEIKNMKHSDGKEHRKKYPYPDINDKTFPLEKL